MAKIDFLHRKAKRRNKNPKQHNKTWWHNSCLKMSKALLIKCAFLTHTVEWLHVTKIFMSNSGYDQIPCGASEAQSLNAISFSFSLLLEITNAPIWLVGYFSSHIPGNPVARRKSGTKISAVGQTFIFYFSPFQRTKQILHLKILYTETWLDHNQAAPQLASDLRRCC